MNQFFLFRYLLSTRVDCIKICFASPASCFIFQNNFHGEELQLYAQHLNMLQKLYSELLVLSNKRLSDLETLQDFLQSATNELMWLNEKEDTEVSRDWSDKNMNLTAIHHYYEV